MLPHGEVNTYFKSTDRANETEKKRITHIRSVRHRIYIFVLCSVESELTCSEPNTAFKISETLEKWLYKLPPLSFHS